MHRAFSFVQRAQKKSGRENPATYLLVCKISGLFIRDYPKTGAGT